jgi:hypothetical protein
LCCRLERKVDKLELVNLVGELENEDLVELEALRGATRVVEELDQLVCELMPQLPLP